MDGSSDRYDDYAVPHPDVTREDVQQMAIEATVVAHLLGCVSVMLFLLLRGNLLLLAACSSLMLATFVIPIIGASLFGFAIFQVFHRTPLPLPLFVRTCAVLVELSLLTWVVLFLIHATPDER